MRHGIYLKTTGMMAIMCLIGIGIVSMGVRSAQGQSLKPAKYATPAEVLAAAQEAYDRNDIPTFVDCFSPEGWQENIGFILSFGLTDCVHITDTDPSPGPAYSTAATQPAVAPASAPVALRAQTRQEREKQQQFDVLLAKYGVKDHARQTGEDDETYVQRVASKITDQRAFLIDVLKLDVSPRSKTGKGKLMDLKINGDTAEANYVVVEKDGQSSMSVEFKKINGSWRLAGLMAF